MIADLKQQTHNEGKHGEPRQYYKYNRILINTLISHVKKTNAIIETTFNLLYLIFKIRQ